MTKEEFKSLTSQTTLLDGATGSFLMAAGMPRGVCTEEWLLDHKNVLIDLQRSYIEAGSQIIYAPTFGGNPINLAKFHLEDRLEEINSTLVSFSKEAAQGQAYVAGDLTTTGEMMEPFGPLTYEAALSAYQRQISCLAAAGVDLLVAETIFNVDEACAALDAAQTVCDLPIMVTMTIEADGSFFTGGNIMEAAPVLEAAGADAVGINCSVGPDQLASIIKNIAQAVSIPVIAKPNAGMPVISETGQAIYQMQEEDFGKYMKVLKDCGARILGGCCGTTPAFIRKLREL
jgi:5-methyltetrahydrofolate--homocysteine methyltransferase